jgi:hypothetical protein
MDAPDFYLASSDVRVGDDMEKPRLVWRIKRMSTPRRDDLLLARISPPIVGQEYGLGTRDIDVVVMATRHKGVSLFPITEWPVYVHVARPLIDNIASCDDIQDDDFQNIAWAELYRTEGDAWRKLRLRNVKS